MTTVDEGRRHKLYRTLERQLGDEDAQTMMSLLPPTDWAGVATKDDIAALEGRIGAVERRMEALEQAMRDQTKSYITWMLAAHGSTLTVVFAALALFR